MPIMIFTTRHVRNNDTCKPLSDMLWYNDVHELVGIYSTIAALVWLKSTCRLYYSYLRQAINDRVTSEVNIAKL